MGRWITRKTPVAGKMACMVVDSEVMVVSVEHETSMVDTRVTVMMEMVGGRAGGIRE